MGQDLFGPMSISGAGMSAQQRRMGAISRNIANAETTRTEEGGPYKRHTVVFSGGEGAPLPTAELPAPALPLARTSPMHAEATAALPPPPEVAGTVSAQEVVDEKAGFQLIYDPQHPDAGPDGYVRMPDVDTMAEMVDMVAATRAYEANLAAMKAYQNIVNKSLEI